MAALNAPHWEAVTPEIRQTIEFLGRLPALNPFYLAGGTALALRLGHRISYDLDLFANIETLDEVYRGQLIALLEQQRPIRILQNSPLGMVVKLDELAISFFSYGYPLLAPPDHISGIQIAAILDIGLMKLDAIAGRGARKDFYDLYFMEPQLSLEELFTRSADKYPHSQGFGMRVLTALIDFDNADQQEEPTMLHPVEWNNVKSFFLAEARKLGQKWVSEGRLDASGS